MEEVMIQDNTPMCKECSSRLRKIVTKKDIIYVCSKCNITYKIIGRGQSERELKCKVIR